MRAATKDALTGNLACFTAYMIFGFNIIFCKNIANDGNVSPMSLFLLRSAGALLLFCIASVVTRTKERVEVRDLWKIALASIVLLLLAPLGLLTEIIFSFHSFYLVAFSLALFIVMNGAAQSTGFTEVMAVRQGGAGAATGLFGVITFLFGA